MVLVTVHVYKTYLLEKPWQYRLELSMGSYVITAESTSTSNILPYRREYFYFDKVQNIILGLRDDKML